MDSLQADISYEETYGNRHVLEPIHLSTAAGGVSTFDTSSAIIRNRYLASFIAGGLSSSVRWALIPLEVVKIKMQVDGAAASSTILVSLSSIYRADGVRGLCRGLVPTAMAYGVQTSSKYGCYELFKDWLTPVDDCCNTWVYKAMAAGLAEATADVLMCPFEMVKVRVQTAAVQGDRSFPQRFVPAFLEMIRHSKSYNFPFGSLRPLWMRQIPGTMVNFCFFESTATFLYENLLHQSSAAECTFAQQLAVTFGAGIGAGIVSSVISHPADSIISLLSTSHPRASVSTIIRDVGWYRLATRGLVPRTIITTNIIAGQWLLYGSFKSVLLGCTLSSSKDH